MDRLIELLRNSDLVWLLPNLRQDFVIWNSLNNPAFLDKFIQVKSTGSEFSPPDFSPGRLALIALDQISSLNNQSDILDSIDAQILQTAIRNFNDHSLFQNNPPDLSTAGLIALVLANNYRTTPSWKDLVDTILDDPGDHWLTPLACLYGFIGDQIGFLSSLVQPGASSLRINLAVHVVLSNPIAQEKQVAILIRLCQGEYGDLLPASERLTLVKSLFEQRPETAIIFCQKWIEKFQSPKKTMPGLINHLMGNINFLTENLFEIEVNKIAGKSHNLPGLLEFGKEITGQIACELNNHHVLQVSKIHHDRLFAHELSEIREKISQTKGCKTTLNQLLQQQAELALILAEQGFYEDAIQLLPLPGTPIPDDPITLYATSKVYKLSGNHPRAIEAATQLLTLLDQKHLTHTIGVWGDYLSLCNLGMLLLDLGLPEQASRIFEASLIICPSDSTLLKLLADSYKTSHQNHHAGEVLKALVSLNDDNLDYHSIFAQHLEEEGDWETCLDERAHIVQSNQAQSKTVPIEDLYAYARCALNANQLQLSLDICSDLLTKNNEDYQALIYSGKAFIRIGESEKGMEFLQRATQISPHLPDGWLALASAQKNVYPTKTVIETLTNASQAVPNSSEIHFALGELYLLEGTPTLALPELHTAASLSPENPEILVNYGRALQSIGNFSDSRSVLSKAFQLQPNFPGLAQLYAKLLLDQGALEEAIPPLELLVTSKASPDFSAHMDYARAVLSLNKLGSTQVPSMKALLALNEVLQNDPNNAEAKALIAETLAISGDHEMAFQAYREALDTPLIEDKNWLERLSYGFGCVAGAIGKYDIAIAALQEAGLANPNNSDIFKALSGAFLSADLLDESIRSARYVLTIDGDNPDSLAWFANQVSNLICNKKADLLNTPATLSKSVPSEAMNALIKAINLAPTRTDLLIQLGNFQSSIGAKNEAQTTFASIASLDYAAIDDLKTASDYLSNSGNHTAAIACLENGIKQDQRGNNNHDPSLYVRLAQEYVKNHDHTSAINTLDKAIEILPDAGTLISQKIDILLELGQPIEALNCIEKTIQEDERKSLESDLLFLASQINRSIGDFYSANKYIQKCILLACEKSPQGDLSNLSVEYLTQVSEMFRALIQPELAFRLLNEKQPVSPANFKNQQGYLDFVYLQTELALETGHEIKPEIQEIHLEITDPSFSRLMAIQARLMNKAGNYKQAEQILQLAINNYLKQDYTNLHPSWLASQAKYLNLNSIIEAALDLGLWDYAMSGSLKILDFSSGVPLSSLNLAKAAVFEAEFYNLCEFFNVTRHKPSEESVSQDAYNQLKKYLDNVRKILISNKSDQIIKGFELTDDQIYRWQARADIAFKHKDALSPDPIDILVHQQTPDDTAAVIYRLHQIDSQLPDSTSINKIIKLARSYPRNPSVLLQVALAIGESNPEDAMRSLQAVVEQYPYSRTPAIAFCHIQLARIALNLQEYEIARKAVESAIEIWQDEPGWHFFAAQILKQLSDINGATNHLLAATKLDPKNGSYQLELGKINLENAEDEPHLIKQAQKSFEKVLELSPDDISALIFLAHTQSELNDLQNAELNARIAMSIAPGRADIYQLLSTIAIKTSDFQSAYEYANQAVQLNPKDPQSAIILARSLSSLGRNNEALVKLNTMLPTVQDKKNLHLERVKILQQINGPKAGLEELQNLLKSFPEDFNILASLAKLYIESGDPENAILTAQRALEVCPEKTLRNEQAALHLLIGKVLRQVGQLDQSIFHLNEAIQLSPDRLEPYLELGLARKERREYQQAIQLFEQATMIAPDDPRAPYQAGLTMKESKDYRSSETMLRRAVNLAPHDLNIRRQLAAVVALNLVHNPRMGRN